MCGEMAGDPLYTLLLVGLGLRSLSMSAIVVPQVKRIIRAATLAQAQAIAEGALALDTAAKVSEFLRDRTEQIVPGVL
jgi:phosphotransferase system enzyme I (PtsI)